MALAHQLAHAHFSVFIITRIPALGEAIGVKEQEITSPQLQRLQGVRDFVEQAQREPAGLESRQLSTLKQ
jgi:hypothetical protein